MTLTRTRLAGDEIPTEFSPGDRRWRSKTPAGVVLADVVVEDVDRRAVAFEDDAERAAGADGAELAVVAERRIPYIKWGHLIRFDAEEIAEWLGGWRRRPGEPA